MVEDGAFSHKTDYGHFFEWVDLPISRSEQTPGTGFHPRDESNEATTNGSNDKLCKI